MNSRYKALIPRYPSVPSTTTSTHEAKEHLYELMQRHLVKGRSLEFNVQDTKPFVQYTELGTKDGRIRNFGRLRELCLLLSGESRIKFHINSVWGFTVSYAPPPPTIEPSKASLVQISKNHVPTAKTPKRKNRYCASVRRYR